MGFTPDVAIPPGVSLQEELGCIGMTQTELATRAGMSLRLINEIISGKERITFETALKLEKVLGIEAQFWINLESIYQITRTRLKDEANLASEVRYSLAYPYAEMAHLGWVKNTRNSKEKTLELQKYFGIASLANIQLPMRVALRASPGKKLSIKSLAAWLRRGEILARDIPTDDFSANRFRTLLDDIRKSTAHLTADFVDDVKEKCASCGVAFLCVPHLKKTYVNGATWWLTPRKAIIQLSFRYRFDDIFWFSFFHEAGHIILNHSKKKQYIDLEDGRKNAEDDEADEFAANFLIPRRDYMAFVNVGDFSESAIRDFASTISVASSIVMERLQHDRYVAYSHLLHMKNRLPWGNGESG